MKLMCRLCGHDWEVDNLQEGKKPEDFTSDAVVIVEQRCSRRGCKARQRSNYGLNIKMRSDMLDELRRADIDYDVYDAFRVWCRERWDGVLAKDVLFLWSADWDHVKAFYVWFIENKEDYLNSK